MDENAFQDQHYKEMTEKPIPRLVCKLAWPCIVSNMITAFYNLADTFFVSQINTSASAAAGIVFTLMALIQAVGFCFGTGSGSLIAIHLGKKENDEATKVASTAFFYSIFAGGIITFIGLLFNVRLVRLLGATETVAPYAETYARYILIGAEPMAASITLANQLKSQGNTTLSTIALVIGGVLNVALDPLFIFVFDWGVAGAAIATVLGQSVSFVLLLIFANGKKGLTPIKLKSFSFSPSTLWGITKIGMPAFFRQALAAIATTLLNRAAGNYGDEAIAAMSIVGRVTFFMVSALFGFYQGFASVCGFNLGAKRHDRVKDSFWFSFKVSVCGISVLALAFFIFSPDIIALFRNEEAVIKTGAFTLRFHSAIMPVMSWTIFLNFYYQACARSLETTIISVARQGIFFIPLIFLLPSWLGLTGVEISQGVADILTFLATIPLGIKAVKNVKKAASDSVN